MPVYTCTTGQVNVERRRQGGPRREKSPASTPTVNHVPSTYVNVVFHELAADDVYTDGRPAQPLADHRVGPQRAS